MKYFVGNCIGSGVENVLMLVKGWYWLLVFNYILWLKFLVYNV